MSTDTSAVHRDDYGAKLGMWLFLVTEMNLFGGLFIAYSYMRHKYPTAFHHGGTQLNAALGVTNTLVLLTSSLLVALALRATQQGRVGVAKTMLTLAPVLGVAFLVIKGCEWGAKFHHGIYPGSEQLAAMPPGEQVFFGLYFTLTGLHGVHVLVGIVVLGVMICKLAQGKLTKDNHGVLENGGLYWHLVDVVWIFLLPLFYLAA